MNEKNSMVSLSEFDEVDYCRFFSLMESPFNREFDTSKFYSGANRQNVFEDVLIRIRRNDRNVFVSAEAGSGKTALCRMIEQDQSDDLCLYANCSGKARAIPLEKQIAEGLLLEPSVFVPLTHIESAIHDKLSVCDRVVVLLEGVEGVSSEQLDWLSEMQDRAQRDGKAIVVVYLYSEKERETLYGYGIKETHNTIKLESLTEYEVYEYLNDHLRKCGHGSIGVFSRTTSTLIYKDSGGHFSCVIELANGTLRSAYRRSAVVPALSDVPVSHEQGSSVELPFRGSALLTARNTVIVGTVGGAAMLVLIWSLFGTELQPFRGVLISGDNAVLVVASEQPTK